MDACSACPRSVLCGILGERQRKRARAFVCLHQLNAPALCARPPLCGSPYIKWFLEKTGHEGLNNLLAAYEDKTAYAQTIFAFCAGPGEEVLTFDGRVPGKIVPARGPPDFGWDPVFLPDGYAETYAEMSKDVKTGMSHRTRSLTLMQEWLMANAASLPPNAKQPRSE